MWRPIFLLLLLTSTCNPDLEVGQFSIETATKIIFTVQKKIYAGCVYLLQSSDMGMQNYMTLNQLQKTLVRHVFSSATVPNSLLQSYLEKTLICKRNHPLHIVLSSSPDMKKFLQQMSIEKFMSKAKWLMFTDNAISLDDFFSDIYIPIDCEFFIVQRHYSTKEIVFLEVYNVGPTKSLKVNQVGIWNSRGTLTWDNQSIYRRRRNLQGFVIRAAMEPDNMSIIVKEFTSGNKPSKVEGYFGNIWNILEKEMNFKTELVQPDDHSWGSRLPNDSWNGMVGMVVRGEAEVAITAFTMSTPRLDGVDFMAPYWSDGLTVFIRKPGAFQRTWVQYTLPFSPNLWLVIVISFILLGVGLSTTYYIGRQFAGAREDQRVNYSILQSLLIALAILCQQSQDVSPKSISCRIVYVTAYMTALIILCSYSATFISILTVRYPKLPFTTFKGLLEDGTYRLGVLQSSAELDFFEKTNDSLMHLLHVEMIMPEEEDLPDSHLEGLQRLCTRKKYAFLGPNSILSSLLKNVSCNVIPVPHASIPATSAMVISKESAYTQFFKYSIQTMRCAGILSKLLLSMSPFRATETENTAKFIVTFEMIFPILSVLGAGIISAFFVLFAELLRRKIIVHVKSQLGSSKRRPSVIWYYKDRSFTRKRYSYLKYD